MKFTTGLIILMCSLILVWGCTAKKDIIAEPDDAILVQDAPADIAPPDAIDTAAAGNQITNIKISPTEPGGSRVSVYAHKKFNYTIFKLSNPDRIVVDIPSATFTTASELKPDTALVSRIINSAVTDKDVAYARMEIFLNNDVSYNAQSLVNVLQIDINQKSRESRTLPGSPEQQAALVKTSNKAVGSGNLVTLHMANRIPEYRTYKLSNPSRIVIELADTFNQLNTGRLGIDENYITNIRLGRMPKGLKVVFDINAASPPKYRISRIGDALAVAMGTDALSALPEDMPVQKSSEPAAVAKAPPAPAVPSEAVADDQDPGKDQAKHQEQEKPAPAETMYTGEKISLDFKDADLKNVLRLLGDIAGINMTIGSKVAGKVTLRLEDVACDEALDIVLINNGLDKTVTPQYTRIDTVEQIKKFNDDRAQAKRSYEQAEDTVIKTFSISYAQAGNLASFIQKMNVLTPNRGSVNFFNLTNKLTVSDIPSVIKKVEKIILEQDIPTRQVMIESKVVQSSPSWVKDLGIAWGGTYTGHKGGDFATIPITGAAGAAGQVVNLLGSANGAINIGYITDKYTLDATLTALENEDKLKILSNPRVLTLDNKESTIKQGVQLPYLKLNENGVTSTEFKDAVLEMKVKPKITAADTISISIDVKKDQKSAQTGTGNEPGIDVRQIKTELLVESGKTVVIGGIYETTKSINVKKVPFFADIPFIGLAFKSKREEETLTEMLVFITVTIVESPKTVIQGTDINKG